MITVYKFPLKITDVQYLVVPEGSVPLFVGVQQGELNLWVRVDTNKPHINQVVAVTGTGNPCPNRGEATYAGSVIMEPFVWHIWWKK